MKKEFDFFLGGVIQGSALGEGIRPQDYRKAIKEIVSRKTPGRTLYCPFEEHKTSITYSDEEARAVFSGHIDLALRCRFFIAYLPEASLGTAIEMWECHASGVPVITISPMARNWVVRLFSAAVLADLADFEEWLSEDSLRTILDVSSVRNDLPSSAVGGLKEAGH